MLPLCTEMNVSVGRVILASTVVLAGAALLRRWWWSRPRVVLVHSSLVDVDSQYLAFSHSGGMLAGVDGKTKIKLFDVMGATLEESELPEDVRDCRHYAFSPDDSRVILAKHVRQAEPAVVVFEWDFHSISRVASIHTPGDWHQLSFTGDGRRLLIGIHAGVRVYDVENRQLLVTLHLDRVYISHSQNGDLIAVTERMLSLSIPTWGTAVFNLPNGTVQRFEQEVKVVSKTGRYLVCYRMPSDVDYSYDRWTLWRRVDQHHVVECYQWSAISYYETCVEFAWNERLVVILASGIIDLLLDGRPVARLPGYDWFQFALRGDKLIGLKRKRATGTDKPLTICQYHL